MSAPLICPTSVVGSIVQVLNDITLNTFLSSHPISNSSGNTQLSKLVHNLTASTDHEFS